MGRKNFVGHKGRDLSVSVRYKNSYHWGIPSSRRDLPLGYRLLLFFRRVYWFFGGPPKVTTALGGILQKKVYGQSSAEFSHFSVRYGHFVSNIYSEKFPLFKIHSEENTGLSWYFTQSFLMDILQASFRNSSFVVILFSFIQLFQEHYTKLHSVGPSTVKKTLGCADILEKHTYRLSSGQVRKSFSCSPTDIYSIRPNSEKHIRLNRYFTDSYLWTVPRSRLETV